MNEKLIKLRYPGKCNSCQAKLKPGTQGWWNQEIKQVICTSCQSDHDQKIQSPVNTSALATQDSESPNGLTARGVDAGRPGGSTRGQFERLHIEREKRLEATWGRYLAPIVKRLSDDPQSTRAWASGAQGEEWVGGNLQRLLGNKALLLHDRKVPRSRGNIDRIAIASSACG